jgi:hypothetical protein
MVLELLILILIALGLCLMVYRGAIHEFQILQREYVPNNNWGELISEQLPIVIRGLPKSWQGVWSHAKTANKTWSLMVKDKAGKKFRTTWANWVNDRKHTPASMDEISDVAKLQTAVEFWHLEGFKHWSWLPAQRPSANVLGPAEYIGLTRTVPEYTAIVATDGAPLEIWLAHEGAIPSNVVNELLRKDPWNQTTDNIPWISEVKYVEIKLRPGNAVVIPRHWYYALRPSEANDAWYWTAPFHSPISWMVSKVRN